MTENCKRPEMCMLSETCVPCAICPNAKEKADDRLALTAGSASLARDSAKATHEILSAEITAMVGDGWMIADLRERLQSVRVRNEPQETILLDGKPLVELWPVELETVNECGKITIKATRRYRTFRPQNAGLSHGDESAR